jgi:predicted nucleotidyltransferase
MIDNKLIKDLSVALKQTFDAYEGIYVYGSQINGMPNKESDIDIVAIANISGRTDRRRLWGIVSQLDYQYGVVLDLHPMTRQELERNHIFYNEVVNKGIFYAAD